MWCSTKEGVRLFLFSAIPSLWLLSRDLIWLLKFSHRIFLPARGNEGPRRPYQAIGDVVPAAVHSASIALNKVKQTMKTLFKTIAIKEGN